MSEWIAVEAMIVELINTYTRTAQQVFKAFSPWRIQALRELNPGRLPR